MSPPRKKAKTEPMPTPPETSCPARPEQGRARPALGAKLAAIFFLIILLGLGSSLWTTSESGTAPGTARPSSARSTSASRRPKT